MIVIAHYFFLICNKLFQTYKIISSNNAIFLLADNAAVCLDIADKHASNGQHSINFIRGCRNEDLFSFLHNSPVDVPANSDQQELDVYLQTGMTPMIYGIGMPIGMHFLRSTSYI